MKLLTLALALCCSATFPAFAGMIYGGVGRGSLLNAGSLITIQDNTGAGAVVGRPAGVPGLNGLTFDSSGVLFGTTINDELFETPTPSSTLVRLNPATGALTSAAVPITYNGVAIAINDLAAQPGTGALYGTSLSTTTFTNSVYRIDKTTGVATLVGNTGVTGATLAFAPSGILYMTRAEFEGPTFVRGFLNTIDPNTAAVLTTSNPFTLAHVGGLAVRPDNVIFASGGNQGDIYTLSAAGVQTLVGFTGVGGVGDIAFAPVPEPGTAALVLLGITGVVALRRRTRA